MCYPYLILGIDENASRHDIRQAYLEKVRTYPPEINPVQFQAVTRAYSLLQDDISLARLRLFGPKMSDTHPSLSSLVPATASRKHVGCDRWIDANFIAGNTESNQPGPDPAHTLLPSGGQSVPTGAGDNRGD